MLARPDPRWPALRLGGLDDLQLRSPGAIAWRTAGEGGGQWAIPGGV